MIDTIIGYIAGVALAACMVTPFICAYVIFWS
jgi:hypothetical protein